MTCEGCASRLQAALATVSGVSGASVNYEEGRARLAADASVTEEDLRLVVSAAGYSVRSVETR